MCVVIIAKFMCIFLKFSCIFILISRVSDQSAIRARLGVAGHLSTTPRLGNTVKCLSQGPFNAERQAGKL